MQQENVIIVGQSIEALTTAVVMASLGHQVSLVSPTVATHKLIEQFKFEHQLYALWQLYEHQSKIKTLTQPCRLTDITTQIDNQQTQATTCYYWLFLNDLPQLTQTEKNLLTQTGVQVILSGIAPVGEIAKLANSLANPYVFYLPFVFLKDSASYRSMLTPELLLLGEKTPQTVNQLMLIRPLLQQAQQQAITDIITVEFARSSIMNMLATRLSFINELARLADMKQVDIGKVSQLVGLDGRIGSSYLNASWGFGGSTLPMELAAMQQSFQESGLQNTLIKAVEEINIDQKELIFRKFWRYFNSYIENKRVLIWGAGYKAGSGRTQNSAIHPLLKLLWQHNVTTYIFDSNAQAELTQLYGSQGLCQFVDNAYTDIASVDALFIINWPEAVAPDISSLLNRPIPVFDAQNLLTDIQINQLTGFYTGIGLGAKG